MKEYMVSIISAALLSGAASLLSPEKWKKYVGVISGMVILCVVIAPVSQIDMDEIFSSFETPDMEEQLLEGEEIQIDMIEEELIRRINSDIERRLKSEFGIEAKADVEIGVSKDGKITGVNSIEVDTKLSEKAEQRLREVYGVEEIRTSKGGRFF